MSGQTPSSHSSRLASTSLPRFGDLHKRRLVHERMDDPNIDPRLLIQALKGIRRINFLSAAAASIWPVLHKLAVAKPIRVLDLACGSGDVAFALANKARRANVSIALEGCDISATSVRFAQDSAQRCDTNVRFFERDAIRGGVPDGYDVIYSSLFLHHLTTPQVKQLLTSMAAATPTVIINDLVRSRAGLLLAYAGCHTLSRSPVVHFDGPSSVAAAFTIPEFRGVAEDAGLVDFTLSWKWPFRFLFTHSKMDMT